MNNLSTKLGALKSAQVLSKNEMKNVMGGLVAPELCTDCKSSPGSCGSNQLCTDYTCNGETHTYCGPGSIHPSS